MREFIYKYFGQTISRKNFLAAVPENWENEIDDLGEYSYGGFKAIEK